MILKLLYGTLGTLGFGMIFNSNPNKLLPITIGGLINTIAFLTTLNITNNIFLSSLVSALITSIYSYIMSIIYKCPATIFTLTGLIPIVPGGSLFYTMQNLVLSNNTIAIKYATDTILTILGIVSGMLISSVIIVMYRNIIKIK